jgi:hypothetical protein
MPEKSKTRVNHPTKAKVRGRERAADTQRELLLRRLFRLSERSKNQPGYRTAFRLLRKRYDIAGPKAKIEIIKVASFMIWVLERTLTGN